MYKTYLDIINRVEEHKRRVEQLGHNYFFVALQGSWNYGLGYEGSDVDTKALILPSFKDIVLNKKPISTTHILENEEHCDLKDARLMFQNFWKQNINFLEILFTPYVYIHPEFKTEFFALQQMREDVAHYDVKKALNCMCGMAQEKYHALEHPYPTVASKIETFGYDGKQLHHIMRMEDFVAAYISGKPFSECLHTFDIFSKEELLEAKRNEYSLEEARTIADGSCRRIKMMKDAYLDRNDPPVREEAKAAAEEILYSVFEKQFKYELSR